MEAFVSFPMKRVGFKDRSVASRFARLLPDLFWGALTGIRPPMHWKKLLGNPEIFRFVFWSFSRLFFFVRDSRDLSYYFCLGGGMRI